MTDSNRLVVFGGFNVEKNPAGQWCTTIHFAQFLESLAERFERVTFVTWQNATAAGYESAIASRNIDIVAVPGGLRNRLRLATTLLRHVRGAHFWVHLPNGIAAYPAWPLLRRVAKSTTTYLANDYIQFYEFSRYQGMPGGKRFFFAAHAQMLRRSDRVVARGKKLAMQASRFNSRVFETIPIVGLPSSLGSVQPPRPEDGTIAFFGQLLWGKGLKELIDAFAELKQQGVAGASRLAIVGAGADETAIREYAASALKEADYDFLGWLDDGDRLAEAWRNVRVLAMPTCGYGEGVPRTIDEGLSRGIPVVATRVGGVAEEYQDGEVALVAPGNAEELRDAIRLILTSAETREEMRASSAKRVERWNAYRDAGQQHADLILADSSVTAAETAVHSEQSCS